MKSFWLCLDFILKVDQQWHSWNLCTISAFKFSVQNYLEFTSFFLFYVLHEIKMKHCVQSKNICIQIFFRWSFKMWWFLFWIGKKNPIRAVRKTYDNVSMQGEWICSTQLAVFALQLLVFSSWPYIHLPEKDAQALNKETGNGKYLDFKYWIWNATKHKRQNVDPCWSKKIAMG